MQIALIVVGALFAAALAVLGWAVRRQVNRNDAMAKSLSEHTAAIAQLATSLTVVTTGQTKLFDDVEEIDDAVQQLQIATTVLRERQGAHDYFHAELQRGRHEGDRP
jgi:hypothetical protein